MDVDLRLLRSFVAVAEELHFTRAAQRLHLSQPALSKQIHQLELQLQIPLLRRSHRQVELTAAGAVLLPEARRLLDCWSRALALTRGVAFEEARTLRVGVIANSAAELIPEILAEFNERRPDWRITMSQGAWTDPTAGLLDGEVDVAFLRPPVPGQERLHMRMLFEEERWLAMSARHPLAAQEVVRFEQVLDEPFIAMPAETGPWRDYWLATTERAGRPVVIGGEAHSLEELLEALADNIGVCFTTASVARFSSQPGVVYRPVDTISPTQVVVAWRCGDRRRAVDEFVQICMEVAARESAALHTQ